VERPVGIAQEFAGDDDEVGLAGADDVRGLGWVGDHADGAGEDAGLCADSFGKRRLIAGAERDGRAEDIAARGAVDEVDAAVAQERGEADGLLEVPAAFGVVGDGDADEQWALAGSDCMDGGGDLEQEADAVVEAAAVFVTAMVTDRRQEFVE
jgi:hypothetical protein